ncbi:MAG TPA: PTS sugar transporter subunit IIA [Chthoniobacteraceae bacterium]|nr:PTS sugar transporter subunit IIA [Chthoniobacteraceae bacterium]
MPSSISDLLQEDQITLDLRDQTQSGALRELVDLFGNNPAVKDLNALHEALVAREKATSTVVGNGVAFPHARTDVVDKIVLAVGRSAAGVKFESSPDPVHLIFMIGTPKAQISDYLVCIGSLARFVKDKEVCARLMEAKTPAEFIAVLRP